MASNPIKKRKAPEQLSPYSQDSLDNENHHETINERNEISPRKAKTKKDQKLEKPSLKGIFGNVVLTENPNTENKSEMNEMIAGLNNSFLKAIQTVFNKDSSRDLRYLFEQYNKFMKDIEDNN